MPIKSNGIAWCAPVDGLGEVFHDPRYNITLKKNSEKQKADEKYYLGARYRGTGSGVKVG
jgi:hypothetical protein